MRVGVYHPDLPRLRESQSPYRPKPSDRKGGVERPLLLLCCSKRLRSIGGTLLSMFLALFGMRLLEVIFFAGILGSAVVVLITSFEDLHELFGKREEAAAAEKTPEA